MSIKGEFNTNSGALRTRIQTHDKYGSKDINPWIFEHLELSGGLSVLDIGCGTGKQSLPIAKIIGSSSSVVSTDISSESLNYLESEANKNSLNNIQTLRCDIDEIENYLNEKSFDRILSAFSIYYAKDPEKLIRNIFKLLETGGVFFFCGPSKDNNEELKNFHNEILGIENQQLSGGAMFMEVTGPKITKTIFEKIETVHFDNKLTFNTLESLIDYWRNYNLYDFRIESEFVKKTAEHFDRYGKFDTTKRVVGIKARKK